MQIENSLKKLLWRVCLILTVDGCQSDRFLHALPKASSPSAHAELVGYWEAEDESLYRVVARKDGLNIDYVSAEGVVQVEEFDGHVSMIGKRRFLNVRRKDKQEGYLLFQYDFSPQGLRVGELKTSKRYLDFREDLEKQTVDGVNIFYSSGESIAESLKKATPELDGYNSQLLKRISAEQYAEKLAALKQFVSPDVAPGLKALSEHEYEFPREDFKRTLANLNDLRKQARCELAYHDGVAIGWRVLRPRKDSFFAKLGIQDGDIIRRLFKMEITSPHKFLEIYQTLAKTTSQTFDIELERLGVRMTKTYNLTAPIPE